MTTGDFLVATGILVAVAAAVFALRFLQLLAQIMAAIDTFNTSLANLTTAVNAAAVDLQIPHASDAVLTTAAGQLDGLTKTLNDAVAVANGGGTTPPPPTPVTTPAPTA